MGQREILFTVSRLLGKYRISYLLSGGFVGIWKTQSGNLDNNYLNNWAKKLGVVELFEEIQTMEY